MNPKVSIIIPCFNHEKYIDQAVRSALEQDYEHLEVIVSDDASTDRSPRFLRRIEDDRLTVHFNRRNIGRTAQYRKLLYELSSGKYVVNLDGDDCYIDTHFIAEAVQLMERHSGLVFVSGQMKRYSDSVKAEGRQADTSVRPMNGLNYILGHARGEEDFVHSATVYDRQKALEVGFYRRNSQNTDAHSLMRLAVGNDILLLQRPVLAWRDHALRASRNYTLDDIENDRTALLDVAEYVESRGYTEEGRVLAALYKSRIDNLSCGKLARSGRPFQLLWHILTARHISRSRQSLFNNIKESIRNKI